jgi:hypothetical protein
LDVGEYGVALRFSWATPPVWLPDRGGPISVADLSVSDRRLAIYILGAALHVGQNLRRVRCIREKLRGREELTRRIMRVARRV